MTSGGMPNSLPVAAEQKQFRELQNVHLLKLFFGRAGEGGQQRERRDWPPYWTGQGEKADKTSELSIVVLPVDKLTKLWGAKTRQEFPSQ